MTIYGQAALTIVGRSQQKVRVLPCDVEGCIAICWKQCSLSQQGEGTGSNVTTVDEAGALAWAMVDSRRGTRATVNLDAVGHNVRLVRRTVGPDVGVMAVLKADAYGHGAVHVARACLAAGAVWLAVATVDEGVALRRAGITAPLLLIAPTFPEEYATAVAHELSVGVGSLGMAVELAAVARRADAVARVHAEVDTGLNRFGIPAHRAVDEVAALTALPGLTLEAVYTHFAASETPQDGSAGAQLALFREIVDGVRAREIHIPLLHAANSGGVLELPGAHFDLVRPGIALYGYHPAGPGSGLGSGTGAGVDPDGLRPVMTLSTRLVRVERAPLGAGVSYNGTFRTARESVLGLVPLGYGDGLPRLLSNRGHMLVRARRCPIVGRVCMDQMVLDLTDVPGAAVGDEVVAIGRQGEERIGADDIGALVGTNAYEVLCGIAPRVPRDYIGHP